MKAPTAKRPLRHLARLILLGIYSGTRAGTIASASPIPAVGRSFVDLERGRYYRRQQGSAKTNKRQPTVPIPLRLLAHVRRWHRIDPEGKHFVEFNGKPVSSVKTAFKSAVRLAGLGPGISPHTLRHTAATWLMQKGRTRGRPRAILECRWKFCSTPTATIIPTIGRCCRENRDARVRARTKGARIWCGDPATAK